QCGDEEEGQDPVNTAEDEGAGGHASLGQEGDDGDAEADLFENAGNHDGTKALWVGGHEQKDNLEDERNAREAVEVFGMCDRRRSFAADARLKEVKRGEREDAVDPGD